MSTDATPAIDPELVALIERLREMEITVTLDDKTEPPYRPSEVSPAQASALRQQSHGAWRVPTLNAAIFEEDANGNVGTLIGPEEIAGIVFMSRRQAGDASTYDKAMADVEAARTSIVDFGAGDDEEEPDSPLA